MRVINEDSHTYSSGLEGNHLSLRKKCPNTEFFWSAFSRIETEYGNLRNMGKYRPEKLWKKKFGHFSRSVYSVIFLPTMQIYG